MTGWPGSDSPNFMDADHEGYISDQKRIAELEADLRQAKSALIEIRDRAVLIENGAAWSAGIAALCVGSMKTRNL